MTKGIATFFGVGFVPVASGTVASAVALALAWLAAGAGGGPAVFVAASVLAFAAGVWACGAYIRGQDNQDPSECVIDEIAGQWLTCAFAPFSPVGFALAFVLFRLFDITKLWPISAAERVPGGWGVMLDDMVAGLIAGVIILALHLGKIV